MRSSARGSPAVSSIRTVTPCRRAAAITSTASSAKYGEGSSGKARAITPLRPVRSLRAATLGWYPSASIAACTLVRVAAATCTVPLTTLDTVFTETPAASATSFSRGADPAPFVPPVAPPMVASALRPPHVI